MSVISYKSNINILICILVTMTWGIIIIASPLAPTGQLCELLHYPEQTVITDPQPEFGWVVNSDQSDDVQSAYQIQVATCSSLLEDNQPDAWNSDKVVSSRSINVEYAGKPLMSNKPYFWRVRTWDKEDQPSHWSKIQQLNTSVEMSKYTTPCQPLEVRRIAPKKIVKTDDGHFFVDFGKAAYGTIELTITSPDQRILEIHVGEKLKHALAIDRRPPGTIRYRRINLAVQPGRETYRLIIPPDRRNTGSAAIKMPLRLFEVMPFRYCEIVNSATDIRQESIVQLAVNYPFDDNAAHFECDDPILNDVWEMCKYSIKATSFCGVYVDGDRERIPYEADAYINQLCHYGVDREYAMARYTHEYLITHPTWPTEWVLHSVLMAWADYMATGDSESLENLYQDLKAKTLLSLERADGLISTQSGLLTKTILDSIHINQPIRDLVDWPPASFTRNGQYGERDGHEMGAINTVVNALHYQALVLMARIAESLGQKEDSVNFEKCAQAVYKSFNNKLFDETKGVYVDGEGSLHSSLHANMFPLAFGLVPKERVQTVLQFIESRGMACSVYGSQYLLEALFKAEHDEYAVSLMTAMHDRSWFNMLRSGSTVTLEAWDWKFKNNLDWNHAWGAAPANIIPRYIMGVQPLEAGFGHMQIKPQLGHLHRAIAKIPTIRGTVYVNFERTIESFNLEFSIPANTTADVFIPLGQTRNTTVYMDGKIIKGELQNKYIEIRGVGSGRHQFQCCVR
ncbi:MAG: family 78 glycoside hydrolase catalytic domain [Sedimentisphaerales bacterium]|nr:family 78 glycoside hydrolase catalytic domain [Sedimentisphaerales bacterium]